MRQTSRKGPKQVWVSKGRNFLANVLNPNKKTSILEKGKCILTINHDKKAYVPKMEQRKDQARCLSTQMWKNTGDVSTKIKRLMRNFYIDDMFSQCLWDKYL